MPANPPPSNFVKVTAPTWTQFQADVAALPHIFPATWVIQGKVSFVGGNYVASYVKRYQSQTYPQPPLYFTGQPSYLNQGKYPA